MEAPDQVDAHRSRQDATRSERADAYRGHDQERAEEDHQGARNSARGEVCGCRRTEQEVAVGAIPCFGAAARGQVAAQRVTAVLVGLPVHDQPRETSLFQRGRHRFGRELLHAALPILASPSLVGTVTEAQPRREEIRTEVLVVSGLPNASPLRKVHDREREEHRPGRQRRLHGPRERPVRVHPASRLRDGRRRAAGGQLVAEGEAHREGGGDRAPGAAFRPGRPRDPPDRPQQHDGQDPDAVAVGSPEPGEAEPAQEAVEPAHHGEGEDPDHGDQGRRQEASPLPEVAAERGEAHPGQSGDAGQAQIGRAHLASVERPFRVGRDEGRPGTQAPSGRGQQQLDRLEGVTLEVAVGSQRAGERVPARPVGSEHVGAVRDHGAGQHEEQHPGAQHEASLPAAQELGEACEGQELEEEAGVVRVLCRPVTTAIATPIQNRREPGETPSPAEGPAHEEDPRGDGPAKREVQVVQRAVDQIGREREDDGRPQRPTRGGLGNGGPRHGRSRRPARGRGATRGWRR